MTKRKPREIHKPLRPCGMIAEIDRLNGADITACIQAPSKARRLADWLNRYADWKEVQDNG